MSRHRMTRSGFDLGIAHSRCAGGDELQPECGGTSVSLFAGDSIFFHLVPEHPFA